MKLNLQLFLNREYVIILPAVLKRLIMNKYIYYLLVAKETNSPNYLPHIWMPSCGGTRTPGQSSKWSSILNRHAGWSICKPYQGGSLPFIRNGMTLPFRKPIIRHVNVAS